MAKTHIEGETERSVEAYMADADAKYTPVSRVAGTWSEFDPTTPNPIAPPLVQPADADTVAEDEGISFVFDADGRPIAATMVSAIDMGKSGTDLWRWVYRYDCTAASADAPSIDDVLALVEASSLQLDVTPAATLAEHYAKSVPSDAEPTLECSPDGGGWSCALYGGSDLGFFYSIALRPGEDGWVIAAEGTEVLPDD